MWSQFEVGRIRANYYVRQLKTVWSLSDLALGVGLLSRSVSWKSAYLHSFTLFLTQFLLAFPSSLGWRKKNKEFIGQRKTKHYIGEKRLICAAVVVNLPCECWDVTSAKYWGQLLYRLALKCLYIHWNKKPPSVQLYGRAPQCVWTQWLLPIA